MWPGWYHHPNFTTRLSPIISAGKAFSGRSFNEAASARTMAARLNSAPEGIMTSSPTTHSVRRAPRPTRARFHNTDRSRSEERRVGKEWRYRESEEVAKE